MRLRSVVEVLEVLERAECRCWVAGWGVDALVGGQTREHRDVDLAIDAEQEASALAALRRLGYEVETDWRPARVELAAGGLRWVDLHPVCFNGHGHGRQVDLDGGFFEYPSDCFVTGRLGGRSVPCLSAEQQLRLGMGYGLRDVDRHDVEQLKTLKSLWRREASQTRPGSRCSSSSEATDQGRDQRAGAGRPSTDRPRAVATGAGAAADARQRAPNC
jgi:lincosamide nucleotidyltransferase A/C/D/E